MNFHSSKVFHFTDVKEHEAVIKAKSHSAIAISHRRDILVHMQRQISRIILDEKLEKKKQLMTSLHTPCAQLDISFAHSDIPCRKQESSMPYQLKIYQPPFEVAVHFVSATGAFRAGAAGVPHPDA